RNLPNGTYALGPQGTGTELFPLCPNTPTANITVSGTNVVQDFADSSLLDLDLEARIHASAARPGFQQNVWMEVRNLSARVSGALDVVLQIDPQFAFVSASTAPTSVVGSTITWSGLAALSAFQSQGVSVLVQVPADVLLIGQPYVHTMNVSQALTESTLANNTATAPGIVTGSFDPNEKTVRTSSGLSDAAYFIEQDEWMEYTVGFQNTGNDTAFTVVVRDTLSASLDLATYEQGIASHPYTVTFLPNNVVEWRFANILLPDSNVNEPLSHGQVNFRIRPKQPAVPGTVITNAASIYFDFNPPIRTNEAVLLLENSTGIAEQAASDLKLAPNPATDRVQVFGAATPGLRYTLIAADGRTMATGVLGADRNIPIATLAAGLYTVQFAINGTAPVLRFLKY
ncbi:MAG TPA: T9SS type A sorting domain-containing protein, partial [Flavobacteriales bacterium]|nr:T9SS type A sorting domain-containing protein [Flavobacteriales bacterium]